MKERNTLNIIMDDIEERYGRHIRVIKAMRLAQKMMRDEEEMKRLGVAHDKKGIKKAYDHIEHMLDKNKHHFLDEEL